MSKNRLISCVVIVAVVLSLVSFTSVKKVSAANEWSQFNSISLAKSYKTIGQSNPCITQKFNADPCAMEYNGRVYVYTTNDGDATNSVSGENNYSKINEINIMSSSDMVNWTDHGSVKVAGSNGAAKWSGNSWAPTACHKTINGKEKFFLYFANNANGIGVLTSDSPTGPWVDPIGKPLVSRSTANCSNVTWLFDPAVLVDSDGTGYLYFGGGVPTGQNANPKTARVVKLGSDMTSLAGTPEVIDAPYMFEDSGINKVGNTYYYSYCTNWSNGFMGSAKIAYMTSSSPMGPFTYKGTCLDNPGSFLGTTGNNHHSIFTLNGKSYIVYHAEWLNRQMYGSQKGYRTTHMNEISIGNDTISNAKGDLAGVTQIKNLNAYQSNEAETMAWQGGVVVSNVGIYGNTKVEMNRGDWIGVSNVDFSSGAASISIKVASNSGAIIKICTGSASGDAVAYVTVPATGSNSNFKNVSVNISNLSGTKNLFFVASGDCAIDSWQFSKSASSNTTSTTVQGNDVYLSDGWYYIKNVNAQKYLQVTNNYGTGGQNVEFGTGTGVQGQKWYLKNLGNGYVTLKSALGEYMLDVACAKNDNGTNIQIYNAYSGDAQQFKLKTSSTNGAYIVATKCSNLTKVLDDYNFGKSDGTNVCQWTYGGYSNQQWIFEHTDEKVDSEISSTTTNKELKLDYTINNWGSGYQVTFKIYNNTSADISGWTLKIKKSDINIVSNWSVDVKEEGDYYVITPLSYNSLIGKGNSINFGIQGTGSIGSSLNYILS